MEEPWSSRDLSMNIETLTMFVLWGYEMSHSSPTDWPPDLGDFTTILLESMNQVVPLVVLKLSQTQENPDFED